MQLRVKILIGFLILIAILLMADIWSILQMNHIDRSVQTVLDQNYAGLQASQAMQQGLDNLNEGLVKILAGRWEAGEQLMRLGDQSFQKALKTAQFSLTDEKAKALLLEISLAYKKLKTASDAFRLKEISNKDMTWYEATVLNPLKILHSKLLSLNALMGKSLYQANTHLKDQARRTLMPAVVAMLAAVVFLLLLNFFIDYFLLRPVRMIAQGVRDLLEKRRPFSVEISTQDEIGELATTIATLCSQTNPGELEK